MAKTTNETNTWPELAIGLFDKLTGRGAEIAYEFENFELEVPSGTGDGQQTAKWRMNGTLRVRTSDETSRGSAKSK